MANNTNRASVIMHQSISAAPSAPPRPPGLQRGICPPWQSRWWGICKFCAARRPGQPRAFDTHAVSYQNITTQRILLENKQIGSFDKDGKTKRFVKACSPLYVCISSITERNSGAIDVDQLFFLVIESSFSWYIIWRTSFHIYKTIHGS